MKHIFSFLLIVSSLFSKAQLVSDSLLIGPNYRTFYYHRPAAKLDGGSLLFIMHGSGDNAKNNMKAVLKLEAIAAQEKLLIVYPEGYRHYWNECRKFATSAANKEDIDEGAFFTSMIDFFAKKYGIDKGKVFASGISGGGQMTYKLGLTMPGTFRAIAIVVANLPDSASCDCKLSGKALPVLIINGTADPVNPYNGGEMFVNNASYGVVQSTMSSFHYWATLAGYTGEPKVRLLPDVDTADHQTIESDEYQQPGKPGVVLLKVIGGKHGYPSGIDAFLYAWDFFKTQDKKLALQIPDPAKKLLKAEVACGQCQFKLKGKGCDLAIRVKGKAWFVAGAGIDDFGDAHDKDGFCNAVRLAEVQGAVVNNKFQVSYLHLLSTPK